MLIELLDQTVTLLEDFHQEHGLRGVVDRNDLTPKEYGTEGELWKRLWMYYSGRK